MRDGGSRVGWRRHFPEGQLEPPVVVPHQDGIQAAGVSLPNQLDSSCRLMVLVDDQAAVAVRGVVLLRLLRQSVGVRRSVGVLVERIPAPPLSHRDVVRAARRSGARQWTGPALAGRRSTRG